MDDKILYFSTNKDLEGGFTHKASFKQALFQGLAPDKGLFMPSFIPKFSKEDILFLETKPYPMIAYAVLKRFLCPEVSKDDLKKITLDAYDFPIPIENTGDYYIIRLDHGPTASFKDFAARAMARLMSNLREPGKDITILVATSGDTGSAVGEAFHNLDGINVFILYPEKEVSPTQKQQLDSIGDNVQAISIKGKFDDCQALVKQAFSDPDLKHLNFTSANSINIGRILPQITYFFYSYCHIAKNFEPVIFSIPSGNFGNSLGCEIARRMGLPVKKMIIATNENDEFPNFLKTEEYNKLEPSKACLSNAMNVGNPSNLARYFNLYGGILDKDGKTHKRPNIIEMRNNLSSYAITDQETIATIKETYKNYKIIIEPHGAVGICALHKFLKENEKEKIPYICIETAHPAKFPEIIKKELGVSPKLPDSLKAMENRTGSCDSLDDDYRQFKEYLLKH